MRVTVTALFVALLSVAAHAEQARLASDGEWSAFSDTTGDAQKCAVQALVDNRGLTLSGASDHPGVLRLSYYSANWQLPGGAVPIMLRFDGGVTFTLNATGTQSLVRAEIPAEDLQSFVRHFTTDSTVEVMLPDRLAQSWFLDLNGTASTVNAMSQCFDRAQIRLPPPFTQPEQTDGTAAPEQPGQQALQQSLDAPTTPVPEQQKLVSPSPVAWSNRLSVAKPAAGPAVSGPVDGGQALSAKILQDVAVFNVAANCGLLGRDQATAATSMLTTELGVVDAKYRLDGAAPSPVKAVEGVVQSMRAAYSPSRCLKIRANPGEGDQVRKLFRIVYNSAGGVY